jgi:putative flippase GtrA
MREAAIQLGRFGLAGLVNSAVGFAVIVALDPGLGAPPALANAAGYAVGVGVGFALNRGFVFRSRNSLAASGARYGLAALSAFALNQGALRAAGLALGGGAPAHVAAQLAGMATYTAALFLLCRLWVFRPLPA